MHINALMLWRSSAQSHSFSAFEYWRRFGGIQQLRGPNFIQFWSPTPPQVDNCGHFTLVLPFVDVTKHGLTTAPYPPLVHIVIECPLFSLWTLTWQFSGSLGFPSGTSSRVRLQWNTRSVHYWAGWHDWWHRGNAFHRGESHLLEQVCYHLTGSIPYM